MDGLYLLAIAETGDSHMNQENIAQIQQRFTPGDPVPDFTCASTNNPKFRFNTLAGRYVILSFYGSAAIEKNAKALAYISTELRHHFDDDKVTFFGVSVDGQDAEQQRVKQMAPGIRYFWDFNYQVSRLYGAVDHAPVVGESITYRSFTLVLDPMLRVLAKISLAELENHNRTLKQILEVLPPVESHAQVPVFAPVLVVPRVLEPEFCRHLIHLYQTNGGEESGSMTEKDGYTVAKIDHNFKRRKDYQIEDESVCAALRARLSRRLIPEIYKAFQFKATHIERYIVACYDSESGGFFKPHRDNTTRGTAHRRFACTINLNAEEFEGGELRFPEFGMRTYRAPTGGAVVFSCSLLHEATPVTKGVRYATLPFLYDAEAAKIRAENQQFLSGEVINLNEGGSLDNASA